jgi:hypothetical protein
MIYCGEWASTFWTGGTYSLSYFCAVINDRGIVQVHTLAQCRMHVFLGSM